jgi:hypothetical protein
MRQPPIITCIQKSQEIPKNHLKNQIKVEQLEIKSP